MDASLWFEHDGIIYLMHYLEKMFFSDTDTESFLWQMKW